MIENVIKRNGETTPLDPVRIQKAILGPFWEAFNEERQKEKQPTISKKDFMQGVGEGRYPEIWGRAQEVATTTLEAIHEKKIDHVEKIQDEIEIQFYRADLAKLAHKFVIYRNAHQKSREAVESQRNLNVRKSDGTLEPFTPEPIIAAIAAACAGLDEVSPQALYTEAENMLFDGVTTKEITTAMINATRAFIEKEPNYGKVAGRLLLQKIADEAFGKLGLKFRASDLPINYKEYFRKYLIHATTPITLVINGKPKESVFLVKELLGFDLDKIVDAIKGERDLLFSLRGLQTLYDRYFLKGDDDVRFELPQAFWMRVAMGLALNEGEKKTERAIEFYNKLSVFEFVNSTPTLFNSGTPLNQLSSCYLLTSKDDLTHIFKNYSDNAALSKLAGGIGNDVTPYRGEDAWISGTKGRSQGGMPWWKITNGVAVAVNQGAKRKGAICNYLEIWHIDLETFLEAKKNTGDDLVRLHNMHTANWIPDLFMKRVHENGDWWMFSPEQVPELHDLYGKAFETKYAEYEKLVETQPSVERTETLGLEKVTTPKSSFYPARKVKARALWHKMLSMLYETGHPWITFKDPSNLRSPQKHVGVVHNSNLCTEILLNTSNSTIEFLDHTTTMKKADGQDFQVVTKIPTVTEVGETAVCNLGSINLPAHLTADGKIDRPKLKATIEIAMRMLDNVIDINYYPIPEARNANMRHRPVGLGLMGWHDMLCRMGIPYGSEDAVEVADIVMELISFHTIEASNALAVERGAYPSFQGSDWSKGIFPVDSIKFLVAERGAEWIDMDESSALGEEWDDLRKKVMRTGMRNSNTMAIAPTATISDIVDVSQGIDPRTSNLFVKGNLSGRYTLINPWLIKQLKELSLWDDLMLQTIKIAEGSIANIKSIPEEMRKIYATAFEIETKWLIESASRRQKWIDMGQSTNLYVAKIINGKPLNGKILAEIYTLAWKKGLKTTYYLKAEAASSAEKTTTTGGGVDLKRVEAPMPVPALTKPTPTLEEVQACSIEAMRKAKETGEEVICEACQ